MDKSQFRSVPIKPSEITPEHVYLNRRQFMKGMAAIGLGALLAAACGRVEVTPKDTAPAGLPTGAKTVDLGDPLNTYQEITSYNNYYEFTTDKLGVAGLAQGFSTSPWQVEVYGLVNKPKTFGVEDLLKAFPQEERIFRLRCVEAWSMVIPWMGFSLTDLLKEVEPAGNARYVRFESVFRPAEMPGQKSQTYPWPYQEGLRLDEAMNKLAILVTGLYGKPLPPQDGAPVRLVVPWKYGFKSIKAITKIELVDKMPATFWSTLAPNEYGFYANVNPNVDHPRWSQKTESRIGEAGRRGTLMFNGYAQEVSSLYKDMDLAVNY